MYCVFTSLNMEAKLFVLVFASLMSSTRFVKGSTDRTWYKIKPFENLTTPLFIENSVTWVDNKENLWLLQGKNQSDDSTMKEIWTFNTTSLKWYHVSSIGENLTVPYPSLTCTINHQVFIVMQERNTTKREHKLWIYNMSANDWKSVNTSAEMTSFIAVWCDENMFSLLSKENISLTTWDYSLSDNTWKRRALSSDNSSAVVNILPYNNDRSLHFETWIRENNTRCVYILQSCSSGNRSYLLTLTFSKFHFTPVVRPFCIEGFLHWLDQSNKNIWLFGGKYCNSTHYFPNEWVLNLSNLKWNAVIVNQRHPQPRKGGYLWKVGTIFWLYGGIGIHGDVLNDMWVNKHSHHELPSHQPTPILPGDTSGLTMVDKLIISGLVLAVVVTISIRLCYKRELNQLLSSLKRRRTPYHQLSQESDKGSRL